MPCRNFLSQLREAYPAVQAMGADVVAIGTGAAYQARALREDGVPFDLLLDPDRELYRALGVERIRWRQYLKPRTWRGYLSGARGARQGRITGDPQQAPGVVIADADGIVRLLHRGITLGDYPPLDEVLDVLRGLAERD